MVITIVMILKEFRLYFCSVFRFTCQPFLLFRLYGECLVTHYDPLWSAIMTRAPGPVFSIIPNNDQAVLVLVLY